MKKIIYKAGQYIMKRMSLLPIVIILTGFSGCDDKDDLASNQLDKIDFKVVTMEDDIERDIFDEGTDVAFALKIVNNSGRDFEWYLDYSCTILNQEDILLVKKKIIVKTDEYKDISYAPVGKPYQFPVNCQAIIYSPQLIAPGEERILIKFPWSYNPDNTALTSGEYFTEFTLNLTTVEKYQKSWNLRIAFIIH